VSTTIKSCKFRTQSNLILAQNMITAWTSWEFTEWCQNFSNRPRLE